MLGTKQKAPADVLDYDVNYSRWLSSGDTLSAVVASALPAGELEIISSQVSGQTAKIWLSGGVIGETYEITVTATTTGGRVKEETFKIRVKEA